MTVSVSTRRRSGAREIGARRHQDGEVIQAGRAADARSVLALRQHEQVRTAGAQPGDPIDTGVDGEAELILVEPKRSVEVRNGEVDLADRRLRIDHLDGGGLRAFGQQALDRRRGLFLRLRVEFAAGLAREAGVDRPHPASRPMKNVVGNELRFTPCGTRSASSFGSPGISTVYSMP